MNGEKEKSLGQSAENNFSQEPQLQKSPDTDPKQESWWDIVKFALITAAIVLPIRFFIAQPFMVSGPSMEPTFSNHDYLIVDEISYRFEKPKRGEVIIFNRPEEKKYLIKRIIGLPGETLELEGDTITVKNAERPEGFTLDQTFVVNKKSEPKLTVILDNEHYFVLGDNRSVSYDSRGWGPLDAKNIVGRALLRLYPFTALAVFPGDASKILNNQ
ncbi:MAG: signal peptidase I [Candidatus Taylorbacteria bacterium]|nr:signal peptidase I [Candidatus Taylorbacteria bacterium]